MEKIPNNHPPGMYKTHVNNGINHQPQLMNAGFLNHQQYHFQGDARQYEP